MEYQKSQSVGSTTKIARVPTRTSFKTSRNRLRRNRSSAELIYRQRLEMKTLQRSLTMACAEEVLACES
jgi:hypothetical protein